MDFVEHDLKTLPLMEKTNPVVLSCTISYSLSQTMIERMKSAMPSLRYAELVLTDGSYGRGLTPQDMQLWVLRIIILCFAPPSLLFAPIVLS